LSPRGATVGATGGYNYQFGYALLGIEGDWNWTGAKANGIGGYPREDQGILESRTKSFATVRGRVGLAVDKVLAYATAGAAFVDQNVRGYNHGTSNAFAESKTSSGLVVGGGVELAITGALTFKLEYLHIALPTIDNIHDLYATDPNNLYVVKNSYDVGRVGFNYRFGGNPI
jgi:outer membrane immunogenic protein